MTGKIRILFPDGQEVKHNLRIGTFAELGENPEYWGNGEFYLRLHELAGLKKWRESEEGIATGKKFKEIFDNIAGKNNNES